ncbi:hypothetical protein mRhiFer1_008438 [Rhinolophus ferrumequinum]|uniref:Uncharacterized protein n=1 Tax=Rhinolophus ferrumequinum TaxID=59479 RepID=A0A7J7V836_RHIFE|nr:hypothetical protein mRhiFer1_008438 [Rhinolophus ferrumequinum]
MFHFESCWKTEAFTSRNQALLDRNLCPHEMPSCHPERQEWGRPETASEDGPATRPIPEDSLGSVNHAGFGLWERTTYTLGRSHFLSDLLRSERVFLDGTSNCLCKQDSCLMKHHTFYGTSLSPTCPQRM